jgi:acyl transferase domain-containing protein/acyl carrier protein
MNNKENINPRTGLEIAVIGMAARFPGAQNMYEFWENLKNKVESVSFFSTGELKNVGIDEKLLHDPSYVKARIYLENKEYFDARFFGYTPTEAELMDPQIRIFHECAWEALEDAGINPGTYEEKIGIYAGADNSFLWQALSLLTGKTGLLGEFASSHLINGDFLCSRISYNLDLKGASSFVQTACSTSLVAIHHSCRALLTGESEMVVAGGCSIYSVPRQGYLYQEGIIFSPDGHCRTFDARANGTVEGEGVGIVVLKRLKTAVEDRDHIYAIIKGTAINNDGKRKVGFTAPSVEGQAQVIRTAQHMARVEPGAITYIEAHGTGTALGDPVEIEALKLAFNTEKKNYCGIGSVKTNIGHTMMAAGAAGFIKTALALKHKIIPPSLHFETPNPKIDFKNSPFYVITTLQEWESNGYPRRAGVSSFGIGGTNAHVVLEEWPTEQNAERRVQSVMSQGRGEVPSPLRDYQLILLSARTGTALDKITGNLVNHFKRNPNMSLADAAYTLQVGRKTFKYRRMLACSMINETIDALSTNGSEKMNHFISTGENKNVIFMFPGQGSQYVGMGLGLYGSEPVFREEMDHCFEILNGLLNYDIKEILYPSPVPSVSSVAKNKHDINQTEIAQPVIFIFEYALAKMLMKWRIKPFAMIGHSIGEYTAACLSGVFTLEDALRLVVLRGRLMQQMPPGEMISVALDEKSLTPLLHEDLSIAAVNSPTGCVVSGPHQAVNHLENQLKEKGYETRRLHTSHAFHSKMMNPITNKFAREVKQIPLNNPGIPFISNLTGQWLTASEAIEPTYWAEQLRCTVQFYDGLTELFKKENVVFIEIGPGNALSTFVGEHKHKKPGQVAVNIIRHPKETGSDNDYLLNKIGQLWLYGVEIDWREFYKEQQRYRVPLPTYPFERQHFWHEGNLFKLGAEMLGQNAPVNEKRDVEDFFYIPLWKSSIETPAGIGRLPDKSTWLVFLDKCGIGERLVDKLGEEKCRVITVKQGVEFGEIGHGEFTINPREPSDYNALIHELWRLNTVPAFIVHLWSVTGENREVLDRQLFENAQYQGFHSLVYLACAIRKEKLTTDFHVTVVSNNLQQVTGQDVLHPEKSCVLGPVKVIPQEFTNFRCRGLDIDLPEPGSWQEDKLVNQLLMEIQGPLTDTIIAFRNNRRWVQFFEPVKLEETSHAKPPLIKGGVYLITGGTGNIGLRLAEYLAAEVQAKLVLTGSPYTPGSSPWDQWVPGDYQDDITAEKMRQLRKIEALGGELMLCAVDVANREKMQKVIQQAEQRFGRINGVIHSAGVVRGSSNLCALEDITAILCEEHFHPKVYGLMVLDGIFKDRELDFFICSSSLCSVLGGLGFAVNSAAHIFINTFFNKSQHHWRSNRVCINWDHWQLDKKAEKPVEQYITPDEGKSAFHRILAWGKESQVIVSTRDLNTRIHRWLQMESPSESDYNNGITGVPLLQVRPEITTSYVMPRTHEEKMLIRIWQKFFGFEKIGILDDFFQLGGDSLKMMTVASIIHKELKVSIPIAEFFNRPTIEKLAQYIENSQKTAYFSMRFAEKKEYYALSAAQERLYILQQMQEESTAYNEPKVVVLHGELNKKALEATFRELIARHESLRTSFDLVNAVPIQQIIKEDYPLPIQIYRGDGGAPDRDTGTIIKEFVRPFILSEAPLLRVRLIKEDDRKHILLVDIHHIITDGISNDLFIKESMALYAGETLPPLKFQYKDYAQWQNSRSQRKVRQQQEEYWLKHFLGEIPVINLPLDYPRPKVQSFEGGVVNFEMDTGKTRALKSLAVKENVTLYILIFALGYVFLAKISGQEDIIMGTDVAGRRHTDLENIIGMFVNTLALRNYPNGEKTFHQFLQEVKKCTLEALENQDYPFEDLVDRLVVNRDPSRNPLFDVMFSFLDIQKAIEKIPENMNPELTVKPYELKHRTARFDLTLTIMESAEHMFLSFEYCTKLFKETTIKKLVAYFNKIVGVVLEKPGIKIWEIEIISDEEKKQLLKAIKPGKEEEFQTNGEKHENFTGTAEAQFDFH